MNRTSYLFIAIIGFLTGVLLRSFFALSVEFFAFVLFLTFSLFLLGAVRKHFHIGFLAGLLLCGVFFGMVRFEWAELRAPDPQLLTHRDARTEIIGTVANIPERRDKHQIFHVAPERVNGEEFLSGATQKILVITELYPEFFYGDTIRVVGDWRTI